MALSAAGCSGSSPTAPSSSAVVTFSVATESFQALLRNADQVTAARVAQSGGRATIPIGRIASGTEINTGWSWHLEDVTFAEVATEVCDGRPSDVERQGTGFWGRPILSVDREDLANRIQVIRLIQLRRGGWSSGCGTVP